ncbi:two-component system, sensor histidine kinase YcbA [Aneurinibacillus thermoaerophilus]|uniref:histidine kinase n=2 Tax=Aneurinibacillus thermoaerophilus TaxID=143495 RepID=A0A1G7Z5D3_ANETH|nr:two-component system, sensor histidine kinase YcbA [Aneurinibacillus thermoaerophilus]
MGSACADAYDRGPCLRGFFSVEGKSAVMRNKALIIVIMVTTTMLLGELKYQPFHSDFRISFGSGIFFFWLIWFREIPILFASLLMGSAVVLFRIWLDFMALGDGFRLYESAFIHVPSLAFYLFFALILWVGRFWNYLQALLKLGALGVVADFSGNMLELIVRKILISHGVPFSFPPWPPFFLLILAFVRSFFIVGFFSIIQMRHLREISREQQLRFEKMLMISSDLHVEALYLKKVMGHIEQATRNSYNLYRELKKQEAKGNLPELDPPLSCCALSIAEEVHEIKKDSQRILSGVSKIIQQEQIVKELTIAEIVCLVLNANQKYARMLGKDISFQNEVETSLTTRHVYSLLSVLNNLLSNAVEAIEETGTIAVRAYERDRRLVFRISDTGTGIMPGDEAFIFKPGYTTKYDEQGNASTGIGLAHVKDVVESFEGTIRLVQGQISEVTVFEVSIPIHRLWG